MKICCYGDSNTFGWDPRSFWGQPYEAPWPEVLSRLTGFSCINWGSCGRCIPHLSQEYALLRKALAEEQPDLLIILLGTNDLLMAQEPDPLEPAQRMEGLTDFLKSSFPSLSVLLLAPPRIRIPGQALQQALSSLAELYGSIARRREISFLNLQTVALPLAHDGVHLSEDAHALLGRLLAAELQK